MGFSYVDIERTRVRIIGCIIAVLVVLYCTTCVVLYLLWVNLLAYAQVGRASEQHFKFVTLTVENLICIVVIAIMLAAVHWLAVTTNLSGRILHILDAEDPDLTDTEQREFNNSVAEVAAACGGVQIRAKVIPSMALNACSIADGEAVPIIAVTKGLIYKLNRTQLEGVIAHEAAHILSGDSERVTLVTSIFEILSAFASGVLLFLSESFEFEANDRTSYRGQASLSMKDRFVVHTFSSAPVLMLGCGLMYIVLMIFKFFATLMRIVINRQIQFKADAVAVRLTRYPQGLAEALYIINYHRHSTKLRADALETLFLVNPQDPKWDEGLGFFENLFSTHPPVEKRIEALLIMGSMNAEHMDTALARSLHNEETALQTKREKFKNQIVKDGLWMAQNSDGHWVGPHPMDTLIDFSWIDDFTPIKQFGHIVAMPLMNIKDYVSLQSADLNKESMESDINLCPNCNVRLKSVVYEHINIYRCDYCQGHLVNQEDMGAIFLRREEKFDQRIERVAKELLKEPVISSHKYLEVQVSSKKFRCSQAQCPQKLMKRLFNSYYHVEIDKCMRCEKIWFDCDELEVMQCMYELRNDEQQT